MAELEGLLYRITRLGELSVKFCFFVDGLDEFEEDGSSLTRTMLDLGQCADIKLCVASRPWNIFEDGFGRSPARKFYVHDLTQGDIREYAENKLVEHPRWSTISSSDVMLLGTLASEIANRAQGVFLWVFLVVRLLRDGLENYDSVADLRKRLKSFPVDLEPFFRHILLSIDPLYHEKMAGALLIAMRAGDPLPIDVYSWYDLEYSDEDYALKQPERYLDEQEVQARCDVASRRLNGWCKGLIETRHDQVVFLHRTVRDFLRTESMIDFLKDKCHSNFHPSLSLLRAYIAWIKSERFEDQDLWIINPGPFEAKIHVILMLAEDLDQETKHQNSCEDLLDSLERST